MLLNSHINARVANPTRGSFGASNSRERLKHGVSRFVIRAYPLGQPTCVMSNDDSGVNVCRESWTRLVKNGRVPMMEKGRELRSAEQCQVWPNEYAKLLLFCVGLTQETCHTC